MSKLFWWNLNNQEKAQRSFILTPIVGMFVYFAVLDSTFSSLVQWEIIVGSMVFMLIQAFYYKLKDKGSSL